MADADYQRLAAACFCGDPVKLWSGRGRRPRYCLRHKAPPRPPAVKRQKPRPAAKRPAIPCAHCGMVFEQPRSTKVYCSKFCGQQAWRVKLGLQPPSEVAAARRSEQVAKRLAKEKQRAAAALARALRRVLKQRTMEARLERLASLTCAECGAAFEARRVGATLCSVRCARKRHKRSEAGKKAKRAWRLARKALLRARTVEVFDPEEVLERDGWRCQMCGCSTPRKLRGTYKPNAPELDHIVAVTNDGEHSRANTQCLCRSCNAAKGPGKPAGQISLAFT